MTAASLPMAGQTAARGLFYPLAKQGVYAAIQGEGSLLGFSMPFIRFAGCDVNCPSCDTDYSVHVHSHLDVIVRQVRDISASGWCWLTGGEPSLHDLSPLIADLRRTHRVALATAGTRRIDHLGCDFISVSPHEPARWVQHSGSEVKLVAGLNGVRLADFAPLLDGTKFDHRWVGALTLPDGSVDQQTLAECLAWIRERPDWRLNVQAHRLWKLP